MSTSGSSCADADSELASQASTGCQGDVPESICTGGVARPPASFPRKHGVSIEVSAAGLDQVQPASGPTVSPLVCSERAGAPAVSPIRLPGGRSAFFPEVSVVRRGRVSFARVADWAVFQLEDIPESAAFAGADHGKAGVVLLGRGLAATTVAAPGVRRVSLRDGPGRPLLHAVDRPATDGQLRRQLVAYDRSTRPLTRLRRGGAELCHRQNSSSGAPLRASLRGDVDDDARRAVARLADALGEPARRPRPGPLNHETNTNQHLPDLRAE